MATFPRITLLAVAAAVAVALSGCLAPPPDPVPAPSPTAEPVFASEEEALAAATEAYAAYLAVGSTVASEGGIEPERMASVTTGAAYKQELEVFQAIEDREQTGAGEQSFDTVSIQSFDITSGEVTVYLCLDTSNTRLIEKDGTSTASQGRITRFPLQVVLKPGDNSGANLLITDSQSWSGANFC